VLDGNKAWRAAETVGQGWLRNLLTGKKAPQGAIQYVASNLTGRSAYFMDKGRNLAHDLAGINDEGEAWTDAQALTAALAVVLCSYEATVGVHTWRDPTKDVAAYLAQLVEWGYGPSEIEQGVIEQGGRSRY
jgi:ParB family chromosome partitioning protein